MKLLTAIVVAAALAGTDASAQGVDLTGRYRCVQLCAAGLESQPAFVTQNGWNMNMLNEAGEPSRAWIDWTGHIWTQSWNEGAVYSPDGMTIQFDRGTVWQRDLAEPVVVNPGGYRVQRPVTTRRGVVVPDAGSARLPVTARPPANPPAAVTAFDGAWSVVIMTQNGGCDRAYRYGVEIVNGNVVSNGGEAVNLQGHVLPNGSVRVSVSAGGQQADGEGHMSRNVGTGTWRGQGANGTCTGVWQAERRG
jgi:hypothetical protein